MVMTLILLQVTLSLITPLSLDNSMQYYLIICSCLLIGITLFVDNISNNSYNSLLSFLIVSLILFITCNQVTLLLCFEALNVPLAVMMSSKTYFSKGIISNVKSINIALLLLTFFGLVSGLSILIALINCCNMYLSSLNVIPLLITGTQSTQTVICSLILIGIAGSIKIALVPFHVWLGKVHVECSTICSVILSGIALKAGWFIHVIFIVMVGKILIFVPLIGIFIGITLLLIFGSSYIAFVLVRQLDSKRWVALYSLLHMHILYSIWLLIGYTSSLILYVISVGMIGHSFLSGNMFILIGITVDTYGSREWGNLSFFGNNLLLYTILLNSSIPGSILFILELLLLGLSSFISQSITLLILIISASGLLSGLYVYLNNSILTRHVTYYTWNLCIPLILLIISVSLGCLVIFH